MKFRATGAFGLLLSLLTSTTLFTSTVLAQTSLVPSTLPACAQGCAVVTTANTNCAGAGANAKACFCGSAAALGVASVGNVCSPECGTADYTTIQNWFKSFCGGTDTAAAAPAASTTAAADPTSQNDINKNETGSVWWRHHWKWVLMVIILAVVFSIIGIGGTILYRRHRRRLDGEFDPRPTMSDWAPSRQSIHDISGPGSGILPGPGGPPGIPPAPAAAAASNGKERENAASDADPEKQSSGKRLKKLVGRG